MGSFRYFPLHWQEKYILIFERFLKSRTERLKIHEIIKLPESYFKNLDLLNDLSSKCSNLKIISCIKMHLS